MFDHQYEWENLQKLASQIGLSKTPQAAGNLVLLNAVVPKMRKDFHLSPESQARFQEELKEQLHEIDSIDDPENGHMPAAYWKIGTSSFY